VGCKILEIGGMGCNVTDAMQAIGLPDDAIIVDVWREKGYPGHMCLMFMHTDFECFAKDDTPRLKYNTEFDTPEKRLAEAMLQRKYSKDFKKWQEDVISKMDNKGGE
jgi:hypothetical protein